MRNVFIGLCFQALAVALFLVGCTKPIPQPEIDAAENSMSTIENYKNCAPEAYQAAKTMMDHAEALLKEERYEEAKTSFISARQLAEKAADECERRREEEAARKAKLLSEAASKEIKPSDELTSQGLTTVYFAFNESSLSVESQTILSANAEYLRKHPTIHVQIEGNCDSRGSTEYNLALGERRAFTVKQFLVKLGVNPDMLMVISYGEERPVDPTATEEAYAKNRRADFAVTK